MGSTGSCFRTQAGAGVLPRDGRTEPLTTIALVRRAARTGSWSQIYFAGRVIPRRIEKASAGGHRWS
jgi:hypothetical protein